MNLVKFKVHEYRINHEYEYEDRHEYDPIAFNYRINHVHFVMY